MAITGTEDQPTLDNSGTAIEYAVKMRQFDPDKTFDQLLAQNQLTTEQIKQTASIIAAFHSKIDRAASNTEFGSASTILQSMQEKFQADPATGRH